MRTTHSSSRLRGSARQRPPSRFFEALARFLFGPPPSVPLDERSLVAMLRGHDGAVAPADVMRVTGLDRAGAEAVLCRGLARHGGRIEVRGDAVVYRLRPRRWGTRPTLPPVWERPLPSSAVTGNRPAIDLLLALVNVMLVCLSAAALDRLTAGGPWWALAVPPLAFSIASLALPFGRLLGRAAERRRLARESGRRRLLRAVLERPAGGALQAYWLSHAWIEAAGHAIPPAALAEELRAFGGEADVDAQARLQFQFPDLDREARALAAERRPSRRLSPARVGA